MSNSDLISYTKLSPHKVSPRNHKIDGVAIHCMAGPLTVEQCGNAFQGSRTASSNYGIGKDGRIALYVDEKDRSYCTSSGEVDNRSITIEVASEAFHPYKVTDAAYDALIVLLVDVCKRNRIAPLIWSDNKAERVSHAHGCNMSVHRDYAAKACPGDYLYGKMAEIASEVNALCGKIALSEGKRYTLMTALSVRSGPGSSYYQYKHSELPQALSKKDNDYDGKLDREQRVKCRGIVTKPNGSIWIKLLKHDYWILAYSAQKDKYNIMEA